MNDHGIHMMIMIMIMRMMVMKTMMMVMMTMTMMMMTMKTMMMMMMIDDDGENEDYEDDDEYDDSDNGDDDDGDDDDYNDDALMIQYRSVFILQHMQFVDMWLNKFHEQTEGHPLHGEWNVTECSWTYINKNIDGAICCFGLV